MEGINLWWNQEATSLFPSGTIDRAGDLCFIVKKSKTKNPKWRVYLEIITHKEFGVQDSIKRGVLVAEYPGKLSLDEVHKQVETYLILFVGSIIKDISNEGDIK